MRMDAHTHICLDGSQPIAAIDNVCREMARSGVDAVAAFPLSACFEANRQLAKALDAYTNILPLAFIDPNDSQSAAQLKTCIETYGMRGLKLHPTLSRFHIDDEKKLTPLFAYCDVHRLHIVIHCTTHDPYVHPYRIAAMAARFPHATFQIAHMGAIWEADAAIETAKSCPNVYLDTGIASFNAVRRAIDQVPEKVLMGADFPFYTYALEQQKLCDAFAYSQHAHTPKILDQVLGENCARLYGLLPGEG